MSENIVEPKAIKEKNLLLPTPLTTHWTANVWGFSYII